MGLLPQTFQAAMSNASDPRRPDKIVRYSDPVIQGQLANGSLAAAANGANGQPNPGNPNADDLTPDYMNVLGMIFSMCALMMRMKWCAWVALYCSCISFACTKLNDDTKQIMSSFMLSISAIFMSYLQNPAPMVLPGTTQHNQRPTIVPPKKSSFKTQ